MFRLGRTASDLLRARVFTLPARTSGCGDLRLPAEDLRLPEEDLRLPDLEPRDFCGSSLLDPLSRGLALLAREPTEADLRRVRLAIFGDPPLWRVIGFFASATLILSSLDSEIIGKPFALAGAFVLWLGLLEALDPRREPSRLRFLVSEGVFWSRSLTEASFFSDGTLGVDCRSLRSP